MTELQGVACHMGSHSVTCYPTQANAPRLNPRFRLSAPAAHTRYICV